MIEMLAVFGAMMLLTVALAGGTLLFTRVLVRRMEELDARLRPQEALTGRCGACDGAGVRLEDLRTESGPHTELMTCFRCGGSGEPLPPGETARLPGGGGPFWIRQARDYFELRRSLRKVR